MANVKVFVDKQTNREIYGQTINYMTPNFRLQGHKNHKCVLLRKCLTYQSNFYIMLGINLPVSLYFEKKGAQTQLSSFFVA